MSKVYFTSDTHFHHKRCAELRGFDSVETMNELIMANWNDTVTSADRVYHLGDVSLGKPEATKVILEKLRGQIYLIRGNHENAAESKICSSRFVWIRDYCYFKVGEQKIALLHYAMRTWRNPHYGSWHLYGHSHGSLKDEPNSLSLDVGVDCWGFRPVSFEQVMERMATKTFKPIDHHGVPMEATQR